ncbi:hypothetical protein [Nocardia brasiliensis]|uniref:hypothetical protein n=1 Tax=Nocardia brasiliensis TaxID=37326 RepID=UPI0024537A1C|nr:hypothetical protein [Nocardia brasiliensis]
MPTARGVRGAKPRRAGRGGGGTPPKEKTPPPTPPPGREGRRARPPGVGGCGGGAPALVGLDIDLSNPAAIGPIAQTTVGY